LRSTPFALRLIKRPRSRRFGKQIADALANDGYRACYDAKHDGHVSSPIG